MANLEFVSISETFKTKNDKEVCKVFQDLGFEETYCGEKGVFVGSYGGASWSDYARVVRRKDNREVVCAYDIEFGEYQSLEEAVANTLEVTLGEVNANNYEEIDLLDYVKDMLLDDEYFRYKEVGNEKLRFCYGFVLVIYKHEHEFIDLDMATDVWLRAKGFKD